MRKQHTALPVQLRDARSARLLTAADQSNPRIPEESARRMTLSYAGEMSETPRAAFVSESVYREEMKVRVCILHCTCELRCAEAAGGGQERSTLGFIIRVQGSPLAPVISQICPKAAKQGERGGRREEMKGQMGTRRCQGPAWTPEMEP